MRRRYSHGDAAGGARPRRRRVRRVAVRLARSGDSQARSTGGTAKLPRSGKRRCIRAAAAGRRSSPRRALGFSMAAPCSRASRRPSPGSPPSPLRHARGSAPASPPGEQPVGSPTELPARLALEVGAARRRSLPRGHRRARPLTRPDRQRHPRSDRAPGPGRAAPGRGRPTEGAARRRGCRPRQLRAAPVAATIWRALSTSSRPALSAQMPLTPARERVALDGTRCDKPTAT